IQRFYFDLNTQSCLPFQYSGCGGNDNNYDSVTTCETTCQSQHIAPGIIDHHNSPTGSHPKVSHGTPCGRGPIQRFYFDLNTQSCLPFQYSGCGGNDNNYDSVTTCETTCQSQ
ncbi:hypothetical protein LOTGIDRAFT_97618, partial [Lottia gigantea]